MLWLLLLCVCPARYADWPWALGESESLDLDREACRCRGGGGVIRGNDKKWREGARGGVKEGNKGLRAEPTAQTRAAPQQGGSRTWVVGCGQCATIKHGCRVWCCWHASVWLQNMFSFC